MTGADLAATRHRLGLDVAKFARALDMSRTTLSGYEAGLAPIPRKVALAVMGLEVSAIVEEWRAKALTARQMAARTAEVVEERT